MQWTSTGLPFDRFSLLVEESKQPLSLSKRLGRRCAGEILEVEQLDAERDVLPGWFARVAEHLTGLDWDSYK